MLKSISNIIFHVMEEFPVKPLNLVIFQDLYKEKELCK